MCLLTSSIPPSCGNSVPGVRKVWLARKANATLFRYANDEFSIIDWVLNANGTPTPFHEFEVDIDFHTGSEELEQTDNGRSFPQTFVMRFAAMGREKRRVFESLIYDMVVVVYQDRNGRYWLLGQEHGLKGVQYRASADVKGGGNGYTVTLQGRERTLQREVNGTNFVIYTSPNGGQTQLPSGGGIKNKNLGGSGPDGGITATLSTWGLMSLAGPAMPLSQLGKVPIKDIIQ